jgi:hypothetical protein
MTPQKAASLFLPKYPCVKSMCSTCPFHPNGEGYATEHEDFPKILMNIELGLPFFCHSTVLEHADTRFALDVVSGESVPEPCIQPHFRSCLGAVKYKRGEIKLAVQKPRTEKFEMWTISEVKKELPAVTVKDNEKIQVAMIHGRTRKFPEVTWGDKNQYSAKVSWQVIVHCLNTNKPIIVS